MARNIKALVLLALLAGCARPVLLVESTEPTYRGEALSRTYFVYQDARALVFNSDGHPAAAVVCDPWGTSVVRAVVVDNKVWVLLYSMKSGNLISSYKFPEDVSGPVELFWPVPGRLVVLSGNKLFALSPGQSPVSVGYARGLLFAPGCLEVALFGGGADIPEKSRLGVRLDVPQGLRPICFHPGGRSYLALDEEGALHSVDKKTGVASSLALDLHGGQRSGHGGWRLPRVVDARFAPDGKKLFLTGVVNDRMRLFYAAAGRRSAFSLLLPVREVGEREKLEIAGFVGRSLYLVADDSDIIRYTPASRSVETVFSTSGSISAFYPLR